MKPKQTLTPKETANRQSINNFLLLLTLFFFSGAAALMYEVLWMKELGLLFGNTAYATTTTLAAVFLGLAVGGWVLGNRAAQIRNPLMAYGLLELALTICIAGYFFILDAYHQIYPFVFSKFGSSPSIFIAVKFSLAMLLLFPPAFFMGGTLPMVSQAAVRTVNLTARRVSVLYGVNTFGAALGAFLAGFYLPVWFGYEKSFFLAMSITFMVGLLAILFSRFAGSKPVARALTKSAIRSPTSPQLSLNAIYSLSFLSGAVTLGLQVLWTRMFSQVLQNSVYTFSAILVVFLLCLAVGAGVARRLINSSRAPITILFGLLTTSALLIVVSPFIFDFYTDGMKYLGSDEAWNSYVLSVLKLTFIVMGLAVIVLGTVFPFLIKLAEPFSDSAGRVVGKLFAINTLGAMVGSMLAGFLILDYIGLWAGIRLMGIVYLLAATHLFYRYCDLNPKLAAVPLASLVLVVSFLDTSRLPKVRIDPINEEESVLDVQEGSSGTVAVIRRKNQIKLKVNNYYTLGGTGSRELEALQGYLPLLLHPSPDTVFVLGLGTGITAGGALGMPLNRLVAAELLPEVIHASKNFFAKYNNNLFFDDRVSIVAEDARNYLAGTNEHFDVIIADLFVPWKAGAGSLYTIENYQSVRKRLQPGGLFMQWLPVYQLSKKEFLIIAKTMQAVFPQVTLWRGDFSTKNPALGLLGQMDVKPLSDNALFFTREKTEEEKHRVPILAHYAGNLNVLSDELSMLPLNSDDFPVIEYQVPITQRNNKADRNRWFVNERLIDFLKQLLKRSRVEDHYLSELPSGQIQLSRAGLHLQLAQFYKQKGKLNSAKEEIASYQKIIESLESSRSSLQ